MRYPASEKLEIIRLVEQSSLPVRRTLSKLLPLVRPIQCRRAGGADRSLAAAGPRLEPHPR
jgi:hypothetical protein